MHSTHILFTYTPSRRPPLEFLTLLQFLTTATNYHHLHYSKVEMNTSEVKKNPHGFPIPPEIVLSIFSSLSAADPPPDMRSQTRHREVRSRTRDVWALSHCSKHLYKIGHEYLCEVVYLRLSKMEAFLRSLRNDPTRGQRVRQMYLDLDPCPPRPSESARRSGQEYFRSTILLEILKRVINLELLDITLGSDVRFQGEAPPALSKLKEIRLGFWTMSGWQLTSSQWAWLSSLAPNLETFTAAGHITGRGSLNLGNISKMSVEPDREGGSSFGSTLLEWAPGLKSVTCYADLGLVRTRNIHEPAIITLLKPSRGTLEYVQLEWPPLGFHRWGMIPPITSMVRFDRLRHLTISTCYLFTSESSTVPLLDNLPPSLRSLKVVCYHSGVNRHILAMVETGWCRHRELESLELQLTSPVMAWAKTLPQIEEACKQRGIRYISSVGIPPEDRFD